MKKFWIVVRFESSRLTSHEHKFFETKKEAVDHAKEAAAKWSKASKFHVLRAECVVGPTTPPIKVTELK